MSGKTLLRYYLPVEPAGPLLRGEEQPAWSSRLPGSEPCWGARSLPQARSWKAGCVPAVPTALDVAKICSNLGICAARVLHPQLKLERFRRDRLTRFCVHGEAEEVQQGTALRCWCGRCPAAARRLPRSCSLWNPEALCAEPLFPSLQTWGAGLLLSAQSAGCLKVILIALDDSVS